MSNTSNNTIWYKKPNITELNNLNKKSLGENLGIEFCEVANDYLIATMPVNEKTKQPFGLLHGGANVALAETLGSVASLYVIDSSIYIAVGIEINANHIKAVLNGKVKGVCTPINIAGRNHIWDIKIYNDANELTCISRFTCTIVLKSKFIKK
ncbi:MAG: hotdog fold thioesterase [Bacteroidetes bacterium]|nr:hotdog fold thioesterase [Bacteroidota bacterium]